MQPPRSRTLAGLREIRIGMPVEVVFEDVTAEVTIPRFRPAG